jgi:hypothetical protein
MHKSETLELQDALKGVKCTDGSLPPRFVSLTLLYHGVCSSSSSKTYLDALAFFASTKLGMRASHASDLGASFFRCTVFAEMDAVWYTTAVSPETVGAKRAASNGDVQLCVRWATKDGMRSEFCDLRSSVSLDEALETIKNFVISVKVSFNAPVNDNICISHDSVTPDAWLDSMHTSTNEFAQLMEGVPHVEKCELLKTKQHTIDVGDTGIYVRISERARGEAGKFDPNTCFHGFLLGSTLHLDKIKAHCTAYKELPPIDEDTVHFCLHTAAVQTQIMPLGTLVTTYAFVGASREPFSTTGNWMYRLDPAIVPLQNVLENFIVTPCPRVSTIPSDSRLLKPHNHYMNRAYDLYSSTFASSCLNEDSPTAQLGGGLEESVYSEKLSEMYARTAFGVDISSRRVLVGDAYNLLASQNAPPQLTSFLLQSTLRFGVNASLSDSLESAATSLMAFTSKAAQDMHRRDAKRALDIVDGGILVRSTRPRGTPTASVGKKQISSLMNVAGISKTRSRAAIATQEDPKSEFDHMATVLAQAILPTSACSDGIILAAGSTAMSARVFGTIQSVAAAVAVVMSSAAAHDDLKIFFMHHVLSSEKVVIYNVDGNGTITPSSPGAMLDAVNRRVFIVREGFNNNSSELKVCDF